MFTARESSFSMTKGDEDIEGGGGGGLRKFLDTQKGEGPKRIWRRSENVYTSKPTGVEGGTSKKLKR